MIGICGWNALKTTQYTNIDNEEKRNREYRLYSSVQLFTRDMY